MKTFSVIFSLALLLMAQQLGARLKHAGLLPPDRAGRLEASQHTAESAAKPIRPSFIRL